METKANYVLIGAFVLLAAAAVALFTLWIAGTPLNRSYSDYDVVFEGPVNGLTEGGEVRFNGIKVGEVQRLSLDRDNPNNVIARIRVDAQTPVRVDSIAQLNFLGITGITFIQILAGDPHKALLKPVDFQPPPIIHTSRTALDELFQGGQDLLTVAGEVIKKLNNALSPENVQHVSAILANVDRATAKFAADDGVIDRASKALRSIDQAAAAVTSAAKTVDATAGALNAKIDTLSGDAHDVLADLKPAVDDVKNAMANINSAVTQINKDLTPAAGRALSQVGLAAIDLQSMMIKLQGLLNEIEQDPSRFVYQQPQPIEGLRK
jgi:phospholipid/cholesterol/gamma-HCH transport system substrate-binding protein